MDLSSPGFKFGCVCPVGPVLTIDMFGHVRPVLSIEVIGPIGLLLSVYLFGPILITYVFGPIFNVDVFGPIFKYRSVLGGWACFKYSMFRPVEPVFYCRNISAY